MKEGEGEDVLGRFAPVGTYHCGSGVASEGGVLGNPCGAAAAEDFECIPCIDDGELIVKVLVLLATVSVMAVGCAHQCGRDYRGGAGAASDSSCLNRSDRPAS